MDWTIVKVREVFFSFLIRRVDYQSRPGGMCSSGILSYKVPGTVWVSNFQPWVSDKTNADASRCGRLAALSRHKAQYDARSQFDVICIDLSALCR